MDKYKIYQLCEAGFYFQTDSLEPYICHFYDASTGNITGRIWEFGDGSTSSEINPVHVFNSQGPYNVCLTITADSLGIFCTDTYCEEITLYPDLTAGFVAVLDTLSHNPRGITFSMILLSEILSPGIGILVMVVIPPSKIRFINMPNQEFTRFVLRLWHCHRMADSWAILIVLNLVFPIILI